MDIKVKSPGCEVPARVKDDAVSRVARATRFFDRVLDCEVVFSEQPNRRSPAPASVEVTARTKGHVIRAEGIGQDHRAAVDEAVDRFERQLSRYKARMIDRSRTRNRQPVAVVASHLEPTAGTAAAAAAAEADAWQPPTIVRTKRFTLNAMLPEDAALQLELLGHEFYLFTNAATGRCNVVYRRRDGDLGLIVPE